MDVAALARDGWPCPTSTEMARVDADAIERLGLPGRVLMETAGRAVAEVLRRRFPDSRRPLVVCGPGNNGGDGLVVARVLHEWDARCVPLVLASSPGGRQSAEARANHELLLESGIEVLGRDEKDAATLLGRCDLIVDALFGVGLTRPLEGGTAELIRALGAADLPVVAVDLPSGMSGDSGRALGVALRADLVITLGLPKLGLVVQPPGAPVEVVDIGLPAASIARAGIRQWLVTRALARRLLPARPPGGHKGTFGHVLVVGGSAGKTGAVALASEGALRSGAGLVTAALPAALAAGGELRVEAMSIALESGPGSARQVLEALRERDALVIGPGLGPDAGLVREILAGCACPAVVDADGLNALGGDPAGIRPDAGRVLTPHPGEAARLLGCRTPEVQADRPAAARALAARSGAVAVLKGSRTLIAAPDGALWVNPTGGPGLATGGTGDVLAGCIGGLLAQGCAPLDAARLGVWLHGVAGDLGPDAGGLAAEVAARLPLARRALLGAEEDADVPGRILALPGT